MVDVICSFDRTRVVGLFFFREFMIGCITDVAVSKNRGTPKWMVKIMENPIKMDNLGVPLFLEAPMYSQCTAFI